MDNYILGDSKRIASHINRFCDYYSLMNSFLRRMKIKYSLDRGAFDSPYSIKNENLILMLGESRTKISFAYGMEAGDIEIRRQIASLENKRNSTNYEADNICLVPGAWAGVNLTLERILSFANSKGILRPNLCIIGPTHYQLFNRFLSHDLFKMSCYDFVKEGKPHTLTSEDELDDLFEFRPTAIFISNPNNPNGLYTPPHIVKALIERCEAEKVFLILDEVQAFFDVKLTSGLGYQNWVQSPWVVRVNSFSKKYGLAEYRIGWVIAAEQFLGDRASGLVRDLTGLIGNAPRAANNALYYILNNELEDNNIAEACWQDLSQNENIVLTTLGGDDRVMVYPRDACFNLVIKLRSKLSDFSISQLLMENETLLLPCSLFGYETDSSCLRLTFTVQEEKLNQGLAKLKHVIKQICE